MHGDLSPHSAAMAAAAASPSSPSAEQLPELLNDELLTCRICYATFGRNQDELPKLLLCSHTFCLHCIKMYLKKRKRSKSKFPCPLCRRETVLPKDGPAGLGNDFTVLNLLDILERQNKTPDRAPPPPLPHYPSAPTSNISGTTGGSTYQSIGTYQSHVRNRAPKSASGVSFMVEKWNLGNQTETDGDLRPPPLNPEFDSGSTNSGLPKPSLPPRIPGAASTLGVKKGRQVGTMLTRQRPQSLRFPSSPRSTDDLDSLSDYGGEMSPQRRHRTYSAPRPPPRRVSSDSLAATPIRCLRRVGRYSEARMQTNAFTNPTRVCVSDISGEIVVIDSIQMTLQMFTARGDYITMFKVLGINGACFLGTDRIVAATHRGLGVYKTNGDQLEELPIGNVNTVVPFRFGFVAAKPTQLHLYSNTLKHHKKISKVKTGRYALRSSALKCVQDVCVNALKELVVLDTGQRKIYVITSDGVLRATLCPTNEACGMFKTPESICTDKWNNIIVSDTGNRRVLKFSANGTFSRCLLNFELWSGSDKEICPHGVAVNWTTDKMHVVVTGTKLAYIAIYQL